MFVYKLDVRRRTLIIQFSKSASITHNQRSNDSSFCRQRMAVLLLPTARDAVAAHSASDFIQIGAENVSSNYVKVYFPNGESSR